MSRRDHSRRFQFLRLIASGGFGSVYLAKVMHTDGFSRIAAVKLLHEQWSEDREITQRMRDEARLLGWLHHRNIVDVIDLTTITGRVAVVMEYLEAVDLKTIGAAVERSGDTMGPRGAMEVLAAVASALDAAYNRPPYQGEKPLRVIHRDIKPSNIMIDESGTVKVLDFGMARADFEQRESHTQELQFGSLDYMPPERLFHEPEGPASDVYSLGCTVFEVLAQGRLGKAKGKPERHAEMVGERLRALHLSLELPPTQANAVCGLLGRMLAYTADHRPTAGDVSREARSLARLLDGEGLQEWAERVIPPLVREAREAAGEPDAMVGAVLTEDTPAGRGGDYTDPGLYEPPRQEIPAARPAAPPADPLPAHTSPADAALGAHLARSGIAPVDDDGGMATVIYDTPAPQRQAAPPPDARPRAMPVARPASRRGPPPPVTLEPPVPLADDPSVLSAPFPRQIDADGHPMPLPTVTEADLAEGPIPPSPVVRSAVTRSAARRELDDDSDAHLLEVHRSSPTLVFPLEVDEPADTDDEPEATVPGHLLIEHAGEPLPVEPPAPDDPIPAPAPFPRAGSALALAPTPDDSPRPPDPSVVSQARPSRGEVADPLPIVPARPPIEPRPIPAPDLGPSSPESWEDRGTRPGTPVIIRKVVVTPSSVDPGPVARVRRATPPPPEPVAPPPEPVVTPPAAPSGTPRWLWAAAALLVVLGGVALGGAWSFYRWFTTPDATSAPKPVATASAEAPVAAPPELAAGAIRFVSAAAGTTRLTATCDGTEIVGTTWVDWTGPSPRSCTVRAQLKDRTRLYAEIAAPTTGAWTCFDQGGKACAR